jgi:hypothetical protein
MLYFLAGAAFFVIPVFFAPPAGGVADGPTRSSLMVRIFTAVVGLLPAPVGTLAIFLTTS